MARLKETMSKEAVELGGVMVGLFFSPLYLIPRQVSVSVSSCVGELGKWRMHQLGLFLILVIELN